MDARRRDISSPEDFIDPRSACEIEATPLVKLGQGEYERTSLTPERVSAGRAVLVLTLLIAAVAVVWSIFGGGR